MYLFVFRESSFFDTMIKLICQHGFEKDEIMKIADSIDFTGL